MPYLESGVIWSRWRRKFQSELVILKRTKKEKQPLVEINNKRMINKIKIS